MNLIEQKKMPSRQTLWNWRTGKVLPTPSNLEILQKRSIDTEEYAILVIKEYSRFLTTKKLQFIEEV